MALPFLILLFNFSLFNNNNNNSQPTEKVRYFDNLPPNSEAHLKNNWLSKIELELTNSQNLNLIVNVVTGSKTASEYTVCNVLLNNVFNTKKLHTYGVETLEEVHELEKTGKPVISYIKYKFTYPLSILGNNGILDIRIDVHGELSCLVDNYSYDYDKYIHGKCNELPLTIFDQISYQTSININSFFDLIAVQYVNLINNQEIKIKILNSLVIEPYFTIDDPNVKDDKTFKKNETAVWHPIYSYLTIKKHQNHLFDDKFYFNDYEFVNYQNFIQENGPINLKDIVIEEFTNNFYLPNKKIICYLKNNSQKNQWLLASSYNSFLETNNQGRFYFNVRPATEIENENGILKNNLLENQAFLKITMLVKEKLAINLIFPLHENAPYFTINNQGLIKVVDEKN